MAGVEQVWQALSALASDTAAGRLTFRSAVEQRDPRATLRQLLSREDPAGRRQRSKRQKSVHPTFSSPARCHNFSAGHQHRETITGLFWNFGARLVPQVPALEFWPGLSLTRSKQTKPVI
jgi:hypothetical protein